MKLRCVQNCFVLVGHKNMGVSSRAGASQGFLVWQRLVKQHKGASTLYYIEGRFMIVKERLGIFEGYDDFERTVRS